MDMDPSMDLWIDAFHGNAYYGVLQMAITTRGEEIEQMN